MNRTTVLLSPQELESLVRRVVREEFARLLRPSRPKILEDWGQEGPEDLEADEHLLRDSLATLREHREHPELWQSWDDFEAELDRAEAAGELPD